MSEPPESGSERRGLLPRFTLKDGDTFLLADALGDIQASDDGLFTADTRILSRFEMEVAARRPRSSALPFPKTIRCSLRT